MRDAQEDRRVDDVAERVAEHNARVERFGRLPARQIANVERDPRVVAVSAIGFFNTRRRQIHADDSLHTMREQRSDVSTRAEAGKEHAPGNRTDQLNGRIDFGLRECTVVVHVCVELRHDAVMFDEIELCGTKNGR